MAEYPISASQENVLDATKFIQRIIAFIDEALARNRELEAGTEHLRNVLHSARINNDAHVARIKEFEELVKDLLFGLQECWDNEYSLEELRSLQMRAGELLGEEKE